MNVDEDRPIEDAQETVKASSEETITVSSPATLVSDPETVDAGEPETEIESEAQPLEDGDAPTEDSGADVPDDDSGDVGGEDGVGANGNASIGDDSTGGFSDGGSSEGDESSAAPSNRNIQLLVSGIILVVILIIAGLFLPPISLSDRLGLTGESDPSEETVTETQPVEEVSVEDGFSLLLQDQDSKVKGQTLSREEFLSGSEEEWADAANAMPAGGTLASDFYILEYKDDAPIGSIEVAIPDSAQPYQTLDLYYWDGEGWSFAPSDVDEETSLLTSHAGPLPFAFVLVQSGKPDDPEIGAEVLPTQSLPPVVLPYLTEVSAGTLTLGPDGSLGGSIVELPTSGYHQYIRATNTGAIVDTVSLSGLLNDPTAQERNIQTLVDTAKSGPYTGVNLEYLGASEGQLEAYTQFVETLAESLHDEGLELIVTLDMPISDETGWSSGGQDWAALGQIADIIYAQMPLDPTVYGDNDSVEELIVWATRQIDRQKLMMMNTISAIDAVGDSLREVSQDQALENYGQLTLVGDSELIEPSQEVEVALSGSAGALEWDPDSLTYKYTYEQAGQPHNVWLGNEALLSHRNRLADRYHLRGFTTRGLGNVEHGEGYAEAIASYLGQAAAPQPASAAIVWAVEDEDGAIVASSSGEAMTYTWEGADEPGRFVIKAGFAQGDSVANLGSVEVVVDVAPEPTPTPEPEAEPEPEETPETVVSGGTGPVDPGNADAAANTPANVRNGPGLGYGIVGGLNVGEKVALIGRSGDSSWLQIEMADGKEGWVFAQLLTVNPGLDVNDLAVVEVEPPVVVSGGDGGNATTPPVIAPVSGGSFELGGQTHSLANPTLMNMAGMNWVKFQHKWGPGDTADAVAGRIQQAHGNGFKVLLSIPGANAYPSSIDYNGYVEFLRGVAALGPDAIEIWNEENIDFEWPVGTIDPASYVNNMLAPAYNAIKSANPNVMVISGAPAPTGYFGGGCGANGCDDNVYMGGVAAAGGGNYMDCIGVHFNAGATSPNASSGHPAGGTHYSWYFWPTLNMYYNAFGGSRQVCFTELGYLSGQDFGGVPGRFSWAGNTTVGQHAQWLAEAASLSANSGKVRMMIIFNVDFTQWGDDPQAGYAMLRPDGSCPSCDLLRQVMGG
ncbi:MAG TPA: SH3 domain-containing protein [candidate division Zixibacteria bacterium]|nr:SH3 domain-containing protein [candidate division Zixibacteria bacterium]